MPPRKEWSEWPSTTVHVEGETMKKLRHAAIDEDRSIHEIVTEALGGYFAPDEDEKKSIPTGPARGR